MWSVFRKLDVYRQIPKDLTEPTTSGGIVSVLCSIAIMYLFLAEFTAFLTVQTKSEMYVDGEIDRANKHAMIQINMNVTMHEVPCAVLSVDAQDIMGTHVVDVHGELHKMRLRGGAPVRAGDGSLADPEGGDPSEQKGEGCNVNGYLVVKRVPGNFHISCHAHANLIHVFFSEKMMNVSHTIHHLSFGDEILLDAASGSNPLNGAERWALPKDENNNGENPVSYEYYIRVVPTTFEDTAGNAERSYQFVANSNEINGHYRLPAIYFRYEFSPITMKFSRYRTAFSHFLVQICAIIGGVFTVMGMVNSFCNNTLRKFIKADMNKLG